MAYKVCSDGPLGSRHVRRQAPDTELRTLYVHKFITAGGGECNCSVAASWCLIRNNDKEEEYLTDYR